MNHERAIMLLQEIIYYKGLMQKEPNDFYKRTFRKKIEWREDELREIINARN